MDTLSLRIDTVEPRIQTDRLGLFRTGLMGNRLGWDTSLSTDVWIDAVTYKGMLAPLVVTPQWQNTFTGVYKRLSKADYDIASSSSWLNFDYNGQAGNTYLISKNVNTAVQTLAEYEANRGFWFSFYAFGNNEVFAQFECILGNVGFQFFSDGTCILYKPVSSFPFLATDEVARGNINELSTTLWNTQKAVGSQIAANSPTEVLIIPRPGGEVLILSNLGGGFSHHFADIADDSPAPTTTAGPMKWRVPSGQVMVQAYPLRCKSNGWLTTELMNTRVPPVSGAVPTAEAYSDAFPSPPTSVSAEVRNSADTGAFVANGTNRAPRIRVTLNGDGVFSPFVDGCKAVFTQVTANTPAGNTDLSAYVLSASLTVPESVAGEAMSLTCKNVDGLETVVDRARRISNRPVEAKIGSVLVFAGRSQKPDWDDAASVNGYPALSKLQWEWRSRWAALEQYKILDPTPFAKRDLTAVLKELAMLPGYPLGDMDIEDFGYTLPGIVSREQSDLLPERGDSAAQWLLRLRDDFVNSAVMTWVPTASGMRFRCKRPAALGTTAVVRLWGKIDDAITGLQALEGKTLAEAKALAIRRVYRKFHEQTFPPEANEIRVTGWNTRLGKAIQSVWTSAADRDPTATIATRPETWAGEPVPLAIFEPAFNTQAACNRANGEVQLLAGVQRRVAEIECDALTQSDGSLAWKGDVISLMGKGRYRILTLKVDFKDEYDGRVWRPASYLGEYVGVAT